MDTQRVQIIKYAPPPGELPTAARISPGKLSFFGRTNYAAALEEKRFVFGIKREDRKEHVYVVGKSREGKSALFELLARQDIAEGHGMVLFDPNGDLASRLLDFIPKERAQGVCVIDPGREDFPLAFNPLAGVPAEFHHQLTQALVDVLAKQFGWRWDPIIEHLARFGILALLECPGSTLLDLLYMLTSQDRRLEIAGCVRDPLVRRFWIDEFAHWSVKFEAEAVTPLVDKLGQFLLDPVLQRFLCSASTPIDFRDLLDQKQILLVNLAKGRLGEEKGSFVGSLVLARLKVAGMERASAVQDERPDDVYIYLDDVPSLATDTFDSFIAESSNYGFCLTLGHRYLKQLPEKILAGVLGMVGTLVVFRLGADDALRLEPEMAPIFRARDMINLGTDGFYVKLMIDGELYDPFSADVLKLFPAQHPSYVDDIFKTIRAKWGPVTPSGDNL